ncbi:type IV pilin protein [Candidatus Avelusimicrobium fimicolum]|uniref:type IV pilin protein n=1 Tax=Candidatus Avelusimicrobium fimicolum TaxID=3416216 RepID=UPI003D14E588
MIKNNNKGFTLIELLVVVLILGILAAMAMPQYFKAVERSRMTEAVTLLSNIASAQQRKYLQINAYAKDYRGLDVAPAGATGSLYYTKGAVTTGAGGNGFGVTLSSTNAYTTGFATATREAGGVPTDAGLNYQYNLVRYYASDLTTCNGTNTNGQALCADFCGIDTPTGSCCSDGTNSECGAPGTGNAAAAGGK